VEHWNTTRRQAGRRRLNCWRFSSNSIVLQWRQPWDCEWFIVDSYHYWFFLSSSAYSVEHIHVRCLTRDAKLKTFFFRFLSFSCSFGWSE
jgi:hypothetical protein